MATTGRTAEKIEENRSGSLDRPVILAAGDTALVVQFGEEVDRAVNRRVVALAEALRDTDTPGLVDLVPTFRSLMVHYDPLTLSNADLRDRIEGLLDGLTEREGQSRLWRVPVLYGGEAGPDLAEVADRTGLTEDRVVELHRGTTFEVYMMGFLPGLPYLGILPKELELPRRADPRVRVPARSIAIAINQSNIYPSESPGGWHILGRTPVEVFDLRWDAPILFAAGDRIVFEPVGQEDYDALRRRAETGECLLAPETDTAGAGS